jgi:hypothetical protein
MTPVTEEELDRAQTAYEHCEPMLEAIGAANTISDYRPRQDALTAAQRIGLEAAINTVLEGRRS